MVVDFSIFPHFVAGILVSQNNAAPKFVLQQSEAFLKVSGKIVIWVSHSGGMYTDAVN